MNITESFKIAMKSIRSNWLRSILTMLGIIIGIGSVIMIMGVGDGGKEYIISMIEEMGSNAVRIDVNRTKAGESDYVTFEDIEAIKAKIPDVEYASPIMMGFGSARAENGKNATAMMISGNSDLQHAMTVKFDYGRFFTEEEYLAGRDVCIIDPASAKAIYGYTDVIGKTLEVSSGDRSAKYKIIGVANVQGMASSGADSANMMGSMLGGGEDALTVTFCVPSTSLMNLTNSSPKMAAVYLIANEPENLDSVGNAAVNFLKARHGNAAQDLYSYTNMATYIDLLDSIIGIFTKFIACVAAISLLVGGIGVMNIMLVSVTERTREIGIRKSLGAKTSTLMVQFLTESVILCLIGGIVGVTLGVSGAYLAGHFINISPHITIGAVALALGFSSAVGIFFGIYPARKAAKMNPIEALRSE